MTRWRGHELPRLSESRSILAARARPVTSGLIAKGSAVKLLLGKRDRGLPVLVRCRNRTEEIRQDLRQPTPLTSAEPATQLVGEIEQDIRSFADLVGESPSKGWTTRGVPVTVPVQRYRLVWREEAALFDPPMERRSGWQAS